MCLAAIESKCLEGKKKGFCLFVGGGNRHDTAHFKARIEWQMRADQQLGVLQEIATTNLRPEAQQVVYFVEGAVEVVYERKKLRFTELAAAVWLES